MRLALFCLALAACTAPTAPEPGLDPCVRADSQAIRPPDGSLWWFVSYRNVCPDTTGWR